jgi:hypothetical protein
MATLLNDNKDRLKSFFKNKVRLYNIQGWANIAESFLAKKFGDIGTFGNIGHFRRDGNKIKFLVQE